jgi:hypothetical protein
MISAHSLNAFSHGPTVRFKFFISLRTFWAFSLLFQNEGSAVCSSSAFRAFFLEPMSKVPPEVFYPFPEGFHLLQFYRFRHGMILLLLFLRYSQHNKILSAEAPLLILKECMLKGH